MSLQKGGLRYSDPEDRISKLVISDISVVLRETTLTISDSIETGTSHWSNFGRFRTYIKPRLC